jgi:hypothetical protein
MFADAETVLNRRGLNPTPPAMRLNVATADMRRAR